MPASFLQREKILENSIKHPWRLRQDQKFLELSKLQIGHQMILLSGFRIIQM